MPGEVAAHGRTVSCLGAAPRRISRRGTRDIEFARRPVIDQGDGVALRLDRVLTILLSEGPPLVLQLTGQADLSDRRAIERALRRTEQGVGDVLVDLSELDFIDVGGVRQLIDHAGVLGIEGRCVRLTGVRPGIMRIFQVCLSTRPPNLRIEDPTGHDLPKPNGRTPQRWSRRDAPSGSDPQIRTQL
jgi:anti-anti-sigma regulatory factor